MRHGVSQTDAFQEIAKLARHPHAQDRRHYAQLKPRQETKGKMEAAMRHRRASVLQRTRREYAALDRLVKRLRPADWKLRVPRHPGDDPWTVKDTLAHIVYWKEHSLRVFGGERRPPELRGLDVPGLNRVIWKRWRGRPVREVVAWHRRVHADALKTFASLSDSWFRRREHSPDWPLDFAGHSEAHRKKDIESALAARRPHRRGARAHR